MSELVQLDISGRDRPGITVALTEVLARHEVTVLDIGQSVIHNTLALGMLLDVPDETSSPVYKELLFAAHGLDLELRFTPIDENDYETWVEAQGQPRHILTLLGRSITAGHIARVSSVVAAYGLNIEQITRLSGRISRRKGGHPQHASIEIWLKGPVIDISILHAELLALGSELNLDLAVQEDDIFRRNRRLVCFDMDSTLIQAEVIDVLAEAAGVGKKVAAITEAAMRGEIDFTESFRQRLHLLAGLNASILPSLAEALPITPGAEKLIRTLKNLGYRVVILSGGFDYFAHALRERLGIDEVHANILDVRDGTLTGEINGPVVDGPRKAELLRQIAEREGIRLEQVIAVGDGANDLPMLAIAGLGIAYRAKPLVKQRARHALGTVGLDGILYLLGMRDRDISSL
ncbi:MAG: phosphoserine phosphatase SerB [Kiritimatiellia bacterium]